MAGILISLGACLTERISKKRSAKKEREAEYAANFEELKAENAKRVRGMSGSTLGAGDDGAHEQHLVGNGQTVKTQEMSEAPPPGYEDVAAVGRVKERGRKLERGGRH